VSELLKTVSLDLTDCIKSLNKKDMSFGVVQTITFPNLDDCVGYEFEQEDIIENYYPMCNCGGCVSCADEEE
jgi:hypothetical protein